MCGIVTQKYIDRKVMTETEWVTGFWFLLGYLMGFLSCLLICYLGFKKAISKRDKESIKMTNTESVNLNHKQPYSGRWNCYRSEESQIAAQKAGCGFILAVEIKGKVWKDLDYDVQKALVKWFDNNPV